MGIGMLTAGQAAARLRGTPYYGYGNAPGYLGNTPQGVARLLIREGGEEYYLQGEILPGARLSSYFPNMYGGIVPLQPSFERINDALRTLDRFVAGEFYQLGNKPFVAAIERKPLEGGLHAALLPLPASYEAYLQQIGDKSRNMVRKPGKNGYAIRTFDKNEHLAEIYAIHTSLDVRQGLPLQDHYRQQLFPNYKGRAPWELVSEEWWGAFTPEGRLVGYIYLPGTNGEYLTSRIMGHGDFLKMGIMNALVAAVVERHAGERGHVLYGMYEHGTDGLRRFKDSMGFAPVPCLRFAFGEGSAKGRAFVRAAGLWNENNPRVRLREWSKGQPRLRAALLKARAAAQLALRRRPKP